MINKFIACFNLALSAFNLQFRRTVFSFYLSLRLFRSPKIGIFAQKIAWYYHKTGYPSPFHFWHSWPMKVMSTQIWTRNVLIMKMNSFYFAMIGIWKSVSHILHKNNKIKDSKQWQIIAATKWKREQSVSMHSFWFYLCFDGIISFANRNIQIDVRI